MNETINTAQMPAENPVTSMMHLSDNEFESIRKLVYDRFGINLTPAKRSLVVGRLQKILRSRGIGSFSQYYDMLQRETSGKMLSEFVNRISTNYTYFEREKDHFEFFEKTALPEADRRHKARSEKDLRVWCAGCSTGEEAYTLVIRMMDYFGAEYSRWNAGLLATDISADALEVAAAGMYPDERVSPLPAAVRNKYFVKRPEGQWAVHERVKKEITFRRFNLMNSAFPFKNPFDVIFCRNVMIYFDSPTRKALVGRFCDCLVPGGYLFIGHSESLGRDLRRLEYVMPAVYRRKEV
ncbi:MAG: protein-glutamate O-methyltransferase CheR [Desulfatibacillum sp.]|nr:protein-glutamate O-methyltransferase CheR [Desulfatibacillum sp.]